MSFSQPQRLDGIRILVVEDEPDNLQMIALYLRLRGAEVETSASAQEALGRYTAFSPAVVVSDIGLPEHDGYWLLASLIAANGGIAPPAIALTGRASEADQSGALRAGFRAHLSKPIDPARLAGLIHQLAIGS